MSDKTDFNDLLPTIQAIPDDTISAINMPVGAFIQEAKDLYSWCLQDKDALLAVGLEAHWIDSLPTRTGALSGAETQWRLEFQAREEAERQWLEQSPAAFDFRDELVRWFRYAFRKQPRLLKLVSDIAEGHSTVDMIQDLKLLAALGQQNLTPLEHVHFDTTKLELAQTRAEELSRLLAETNGERRIGNTDRVLRDKAYTYLKEAVDEIRECGKFVFFDNPTRYRGYISTYYSRSKNTSSALTAETTMI